jgi:hypothetical protein
MFEYNFGDSEIKMLFLVLISLPYAWHKALEAANGTNSRPAPFPEPEPVGAS